MNAYKQIAIGSILSILVIVPFIFRKFPMHALNDIRTINDAVRIFPTSATEITKHTQAALADARATVQDIIAVADDKRTFANTVKKLDILHSHSDLSILLATLSMVEILYPEESLRQAAHDAILEIKNFYIDTITNNIQLYHALKAYAHGNAKNESLTEEQNYFIQETLHDFERSGLNLPQEQREQITTIEKELAALSLEFDKNIAEAQNTITVTKEGLSGLEQDFITNLKKTAEGLYILGVDYPTYFTVMDSCTNATTRKALYQAFQNRAYPQNKLVLQKIIAKRHELAQLLGFATYAALDLDNQMVKNPARAQAFLKNIADKTHAKIAQEIKELTSELPASVHLTDDKKIYPWDITFLKDNYKKRQFNIDEQKIAEYFPVEQTINGLLTIYEKFFNLTFTQLPAQKLWDAEVRAIEVIDNTLGHTVGYLFLDLFPRPNKYSHAAHQSIVHVALR